jgi:hypothetical protein
MNCRYEVPFRRIDEASAVFRQPRAGNCAIVSDQLLENQLASEKDEHEKRLADLPGVRCDLAAEPHGFHRTSDAGEHFLEPIGFLWFIRLTEPDQP